MTKRELFFEAVEHREATVPSWTMAFFNDAVAARLIGAECVLLGPEDETEYGFGASSREDRLRNLRFAEATDNYAIAVGQRGSAAFGHCGPGEFLARTIDRHDNGFISQFETGTKRKTQLVPHFYHNYDHPLETLEDVDALDLPDPNDPARYAGIAEEAEFYQANGYYAYANLNGLFSGIHYFCYPYDKLFMDMILDPDGLTRLVAKLSAFNLTAAENLLRCGIDSIAFCDDLGDGRNLLFSPEILETFFLPYYRDLADLCHGYGAHLHMHSHGNILRILPALIDTGIDLINPFDPYEVGPMKGLKEAFGARITIVGGLNKFFFDWPEGEMVAFIKRTIAEGRKGGGFVLMDSGGIPESVTREQYDFYRRISRELRE